MVTKEIEQDGFITRDEDLVKSEPKIQKSMVLIKEMTMPFSCDRCRLLDRDHNECTVKWKRISPYRNERRKPEWCPLTEVIPYGPEGTLYKEK